MSAAMRQLNQMLASFSTKQLLLLTSLVCCYWLYTWWSVAGLERRSSGQLREDILLLSELYVRALAKEQREEVDGPYGGRLTAADLKRTMAVLLQNIMERLERLEQRMSNATATNDTAGPVEAARSGKPPPQSPSSRRVPLWSPPDPPQSVTCGLSGASMTNTMRALWPECEQKLDWMRRHWRSDACYANYGVDGSFCSFFYFLSEVENFCPRLTSKRQVQSGRPVNRTTPRFAAEDAAQFSAITAEVRGGMAREFHARTAEVWLDLSSAGQRLLARGALAPIRLRLRIALFPSILANGTGGLGFPLPLSEEAKQLMLRQWADLSTALFQLGHHLIFCNSAEQLELILRRFPDAKSPCQARRNLFLDLLYTDHVGLALFRRRLGPQRFARFNCLLRVIDPFGTEPAFNFGRTGPACGFNLNPKQYLTSTPADITPDNSFLGLVLLPSSPPGLAAPTRAPLRPLALLHLTRDSLPPTQAFLAALQRHFRVVAASLDRQLLPETSTVLTTARLGLSWPAYSALLHEAAVFVGLGSPVDSGMTLMALAAGCAVLNPMRRAPVPLYRIHLGWPSARAVTSQQNYLQRHLQPPHVLSYKPREGAEDVLRQLAGRRGRLRPLVPHEFGAEAFLQRLDLFLQRQDLCEAGGSLGASGSPLGRALWPPASAVLFYLGVLGDSCEKTCRRRGLICEPAHFAGINSRIELQERGVRCDHIAFEAAAENPHFVPASATCCFQSEPRLFSCAGAKPGVMRLCPCRDALPGQSALCAKCL